MLTIGELAKKVGVRPSTLRYYEQEGLLAPDSRSDAGYRLYEPAAEARLLLIQRAQRLGFSLADVGTLLAGWDAGSLSNAAIIETAEDRYLALEKRLTELLVLKHELELFLQDLHRREGGQTAGSGSTFAQMLARVCANPITQPPAKGLLDWLTQYSGCRLTSDAGRHLLDKMRGQHVHIWQEGEDYNILIVSKDPSVAEAVAELAALEAGCEAHESSPTPEMVYDDEGYLLKAFGPNAFILARFFMALEQEEG
jgi:MerR family copper efflux transcriptional regulator